VLNYLGDNYQINNIQVGIQKNKFDDFILKLIEKDKAKDDK
jgi:hypothetical protein